MAVHHLIGPLSTQLGAAATLDMAIHHAHMMANRGHRARHIRLQVVQYGVRLLVSHHMIAQRFAGIFALQLVGQLLYVIAYEPLELPLHRRTVRVAIDLQICERI